ncbi:AMP-binding protein [Arthrobacter sp. zg-Y820]|uniref:class I adenylate-forming enzyme family protein n=1 Tax=unclassified Arthrobacter TaxID=235627 RepID=UPI001E5D09F4|nr:MULTISPECIES: AMP-binding protein [unclassified Arthrobacter]MCC9195292.1 AMP-binding protein [Arthrobacter sp. zg-Y820]MDK1278151.1 AMP-binding protein [Arthrobacter sp. zg.Y820]
MSSPFEIHAQSVVEAWRRRVQGNPQGTAIAYFDQTLTAAQLDELSDAFAAALQNRGVGHGDRIGIQLQNIPQYAISFLALWKLGATAVLLNPMYKGRELRHLIDDSRSTGIIAEDTLYPATADTVAGSSVQWIVTTSGLEYQSRNDPRVFPKTEPLEPSPDGDMAELISAFAGRSPAGLAPGSAGLAPGSAGLAPGSAGTTPGPDDVALLSYTSGTTGPPKGAMNTHRNVLNVAATSAAWMGLQPGDRVLAVAPLFHITGAVLGAAAPLLQDTTLVFINRTHPAVVVDAIAEHKVTCTTGSITVFNAIYQIPGATAEHFASIRTLYSGGAPIPPATVEGFRARFGKYIHNIYGMTETTSGVIAVPPGVDAPVDPASGSLSIGLPLPNVTVRIIDADGNPLPAGEQGELELAGPQIVPGYWNNPEATARTMPGGRLRTGDVAVVDADGWVYIVDRLKDQINVSGFKVWPREVEDVLYEHPAVFEAAVVGQPDPYRGETVVAYVSLKPGHTLTEEEVIEFTKQRLAAYKYPRIVHVIEDLPKTQTGKIRRKVLRDSPLEGQA